MEGLKNNESLLLILQEDSKIKLYKKINREFTINNAQEIEYADGINIITPTQWYLLQRDNFNAERFLKEWEKLILKEREIGKTGLRIFVEADTILIERFENALIRFGEILADYLSFPITCIYAYEREDIGKMNQQKLVILNLSHGIVGFSNNARIFDNPFKSHCICLVDDKRKNVNVSPNTVGENEYLLNEQIFEFISNIINERLSRGESCIYATINKRNQKLVHYLSKNIIDYRKNTNNGNFQLFDFSYHYLAALCGDYSPFEEFVKYLNLHLNYSNSSIIYFICDWHWLCVQK